MLGEKWGKGPEQLHPGAPGVPARTPNSAWARAGLRVWDPEAQDAAAGSGSQK